MEGEDEGSGEGPRTSRRSSRASAHHGSTFAGVIALVVNAWAYCSAKKRRGSDEEQHQIATRAKTLLTWWRRRAPSGRRGPRPHPCLHVRTYTPTCTYGLHARIILLLHGSPYDSMNHHASAIYLIKTESPAGYLRPVQSAIFLNSVRMRSCTKVIVYKKKVIQDKQALISYMRHKYTCGRRTHLYICITCNEYSNPIYLPAHVKK